MAHAKGYKPVEEIVRTCACCNNENVFQVASKEDRSELRELIANNAPINCKKCETPQTPEEWSITKSDMFERDNEVSRGIRYHD